MAKSDTHREWLRMAEACALLYVTSDTLRRWADRGHIRTIRTPGNQRRFSREDVERIAREGIAA